MARTDDYAGVGIRIFPQEGLDHGESLIILVRDGEDDFKVGVFLAKGRLEIFEQIGVETFQWTQNRHSRDGIWGDLAARGLRMR
jgi:hypothetical protein